MNISKEWRTESIREKQRMDIRNQPTTIKRCLGECDGWFHSTGSDHRICNPCKGVPNAVGSPVGRRVIGTGRNQFGGRQFRYRD